MTQYFRPMGILLMVLGTSVQGAMYKWIDENGQVVYSQSPPPSGEAIRIKPAPAPDPAEVERARRWLDQTREQDAERNAEQERQRAEREAAGQDREIRAKNCAIARQNLQTIENLGRRRIMGPDGTPIFLSDEERAARIERAQKNIETYCD